MKCVIINTRQCTEIVYLANIIYCRAEGSYTKVYLKDGGSIFCSKNLAWFENEIQSKLFLRVHRSFLINLNFLSKVYRNEGRINLQNGAAIPLSRGGANQLKNSLHLLRAGQPFIFCGYGCSPYYCTAVTGFTICKQKAYLYLK